MHKKRLKLIYFSLGGSEVKEFSLNLPKIILFSTILLTACTAIVFVVLLAFTNVFQNAQVVHIQEQNSELKAKIAEFDKKASQLESKIELIERDDSDLRVFVDLDQVDDETKQMGIGGAATKTFSMYANSNDITLKKAYQTERTLESLTQKMEYLTQSREEIKNKYNANLDSLRRIPTICPVHGARVTSEFNYRIHPILGVRKFHEGIDYGVRRGTDIFAPADGVVSTVVNQYKANESYGKYIVINHENGITTKYGHLSRIFVQEGQRVSRWTRIGQVGTTGRSTAPHLHYEVREHGKPVNPRNYVFEDSNGE